VADLDLGAAKTVANECAAVAADANFRAEAVAIDVTQQASIEKATGYALETFGRIDYCVNSAGVSI
jgi:NAD(P)-dependent dehydrogenase (short-subunit alcohol dehydrogenase family)